MKCPFCNAEAEKGTACLSAIQGFGNMLLSFTSEENAKKSFFKRKSESKIILFGDEFAAYRCPECKRVTAVFEDVE